MSESDESLDGCSRAAILLMTLGEESATEVLKYMDQQEVEQIGMAMAEIVSVSQEHVDSVIESFAEEVQGHTSLGIGSEDYLRTILTSALGQESAEGLLDRILAGRNTNGLEALKWMEPALVADMLKEEHPQVVAVVASHLSRERAAQVLMLLPAQLRADAVMRIASLDGIQRAAISELDEMMERRIADAQGEQAKDLGGKRAAAEIVLKLGSDMEDEVLGYIGEVDDELSSEIKELMFVFDSLAALDDRGMQALLREIPGDRLGVALKGAEPATSDLFLRNMSKRAAELLQEDMEARGPIRLSDVEEAQKDILTIALKLADEGKIQLGGGSDDYV